MQEEQRPSGLLPLLEEQEVRRVCLTLHSCGIPFAELTCKLANKGHAPTNVCDNHMVFARFGLGFPIVMALTPSTTKILVTMSGLW